MFLDRGKKHVKDTGWTYWQHLTHSFHQSNRLIWLGLKSYAHGIFPWMFISDGPLGVYRMYKEIKHFHHLQKLFNKENDKKN